MTQLANKNLNVIALDNAAMHCIKGGDAEEAAACVIDNGSGI